MAGQGEQELSTGEAEEHSSLLKHLSNLGPVKIGEVGQQKKMHRHTDPLNKVCMLRKVVKANLSKSILNPFFNNQFFHQIEMTHAMFPECLGFPSLHPNQTDSQSSQVVEV